MATKKATFKVDNGNGYDEIMFKTTADQVVFSDGSNFQNKLDNGQLKGPTDPTGATGPTGAPGKDGLTTSITVNSTKYTQSSGNITLPDYPTLSSLGAAASSHTHNYAASSSAGGAANSANTLTTARTINGTSFNGSANITTAN